MVTPEAANDIRVIYRRIRREAPAAAARWRQEIRAHIKTIERFPGRASLAPESETFDEPSRQLLYGRGNRGTYRILFSIQEEMIFVLHVRHGSMNVLLPKSE